MKLVYTTLQSKIEIEQGVFNSIIIENQNYYYQLVHDLKLQIDGKEGGWVLSENDTPLGISKNIELLIDYFDINCNHKTIITKVINALEKKASNNAYIDATLQLLADAERYIYNLSEDYEIMIDCDKVTISQLLKAMGITVHIDSEEITEVLYTYMQVFRQFVGDRLFVFVNMRSYVSNIQFDEFVKTIISHGYQAIFLENKEYPILENERRLIIDEDLCEI